MVRKRTKSKPVLVGEKEQKEKITYEKAVLIPRYCDNLPPLIQDYINKEKE